MTQSNKASRGNLNHYIYNVYNGQNGGPMARKSLLMSLMIILIFSFSASATINKLSINDLADKAETIIIGKVAEKQSAWDESHKQIITTVTVNVSEYLKGDERTKTQIIRVPGGEVDGVGLTVPGAPSFVDGEKALLFLTSKSNDSKYLLTFSA